MRRVGNHDHDMIHCCCLSDKMHVSDVYKYIIEDNELYRQYAPYVCLIYWLGICSRWPSSGVHMSICVRVMQDKIAHL